jgi:hypothetical protein
MGNEVAKNDHDLAWDSPLQKVAQWFGLLRLGPRDLTRQQLADVMPPRGPAGSYQNAVRGARVRTLNNRGFTLEGKRVR